MTLAAADAIESASAVDPAASAEPAVVGNAADLAAAEMEVAVNDDEEDDAPLPSMEDMEDLILEAYNNMQSDGEHIFLPPDVASKLHYIAELVKTAGYVSDDGMSVGSESNQEGAARVAAAQHEVSQLTAETLEQLVPPPLDLNRNNAAHVPTHGRTKTAVPKASAIGTRKRVAASSKAAAAPISSTTSQRRLSNKRKELLTISDLHADAEPSPATLSPDTPASPPLSARERSTSLVRKRDTQRKSSSIPPPSDIRRKTAPRAPSSTKSATRSTTDSNPGKTPRPTLSTSRVKATESTPVARERSTSAYEQRREAALKLKEDKAQRELQAREAVRKQREEARRKLEDAHQKELEAKRERVARMKMQRKPTPTTTTTTTTSTSKPSSIR